MRYLRYTLIMLLAFIVSLGVEAKKVKLSKNIVYEGTVQNGEPNGKGCLKVYSCLDKNLTLLTLNGDFKIFGEAVIPEKTNIKVFINGIEQV